MPKLKTGLQAPTFQKNDIFNQNIDLTQYKGKKVMLSFYRYASCPLCNLRVNELINRFEDLNKQGLEMIAVFQSPTESILNYVGKQDAPFPIIPDPEQKLYNLYSVSGNWLKFVIGLKPRKIFDAAKNGFLPGKIETEMKMIPADFLIDENGKIHTAHYGKDSSDHLSILSIENFLKLQT